MKSSEDQPSLAHVCVSFSTNADAAGSSSAAETSATSHNPSGCEEQDVAEEGGGEQTAEVLTADDSKCLPEETEASSGADEDPPASAQDDPSLSPAPQDEQELFNSFHYWRTPIPEIDLDLELLEEEKEKRPSAPALGRKQLEELIENLEPHIDDPDVKGERWCFLIKWI